MADNTAPLRASVVVDLPVEQAFDLFVSQIGQWWPMPYTYAEDEFETAVIEPREGGRWFERVATGAEITWGEVRVFERPTHIVVSYAVSAMRAPESPEHASEVEIVFVSTGEQRTRIDLEHRDFERHGEGAKRLREGMASRQGWPLILASFGRLARAQ
jgi:uncharacterized protein YndB with AHSA1/START domain